MNNRDNLNLGEEIKDIVQDALKNKEFNKLNQDVQNVVKGALNEVRKSFKSKSMTDRDTKKGTNINLTKQTNHSNKDIVISNYSSTYLGTNNNKKLSLRTAKYIVPSGKLSSLLFTIFGIIGSLGFGISLFILLILGNFIGGFFNSIAIGLLPLFALSIGLILRGNSIRKRLKRFQKYVSCLDGRDYCLIDELSSLTGLSNKYIVKDLGKMIQIGMFPEGHIDNKKTTFVLTNECYKKYLQVKYLEIKKDIARKDLDKKETIKLKESSVYELGQAVNKDNGLSLEMKKSLDEGRKLVLEIKDANNLIPRYEISHKLDKLEEVIGKIFDYVEIHPEKFTEIKKFTEYFLPTTLKLVDAYRRIDSQTLQGENISSAKKEIEETMDTINIAFENLLNDLYQDMAMDISTDISVLETMLAQEGLTDSNMKIKK